MISKPAYIKQCYQPFYYLWAWGDRGHQETSISWKSFGESHVCWCLSQGLVWGGSLLYSGLYRHVPLLSSSAHGGRETLARQAFTSRDCRKVKTWPSSSPGTMCTAFFVAPGLVIQCQNVLAPENLGAKQVRSSQQEKGPSFSLPWNRLPVFVSLGLHLAYGRGCGSAWCFENWKLNGISSQWWSGTHGLESGNRNPVASYSRLTCFSRVMPSWPPSHPVPRTKGMTLRGYLMGKVSLLASQPKEWGGLLSRVRLGRQGSADAALVSCHLLAP